MPGLAERAELLNGGRARAYLSGFDIVAKSNRRSIFISS
jgi:hypothetical protein